MTPYFSSEFRVLDISKNILFLLDILAIIQSLFHQCSPSIKSAIIFISYFDLVYAFKVSFSSSNRNLH